MDLADTANVHHLADTASNLVDKFVPVSFQVCLLLPCMVESVFVQATPSEVGSSNFFFSPLFPLFPLAGLGFGLWIRWMGECKFVDCWIEFSK
jgi:hypothetical protein